MTTINPIQHIPYYVQSKYSRVNPTEQVTESHTFVAINGGYPIHQIVATSKIYDRHGKHIENKYRGHQVDKLA